MLRILSRVAAFLAVLIAAPRAVAAANATATTATIPAADPDGKAFEYRWTLLRETPRHTVYTVTYPSPMTTAVAENNTIPAEYYLPKGIGPDEPKRPAVICLHILGGNFELVRLLCAVIADRGVPAIMFKLPYYGERAPRDIRRRLQRDAGMFAHALDQSMLDIDRTASVLASRPEVDPKRIGISGISLGAIVGSTAAGRSGRFWRAGLVLGGADLTTIIHHARETRQLSAFIKAQKPEERQRIEGFIANMDPLRYGDGLHSMGEAGRVLMINATDDEVIPRSCTDKLARAAGITDEVVWLEGLAHYTAMASLPSIVQQIGEFFAQDLPKGATLPPEPKATALPPEHRLAAFVRQVITLIGPSPAEGRCHLALLDASVKQKNGKELRKTLDLRRGSGARFRLACELPELGDVTLGNGEAPWLVSCKGKCFVGSTGDAGGRTLPMFLNPQLLLKARVAWGALSAMTVSPNAFRNYLTITPKREDDGKETLALDIHHRHAHGKAALTFAADGTTPETFTFDVDGTSGTVRFKQWQIDTVGTDELFLPPSENTQPVRREDLYRMFGALFAAIGEEVE